MGVKVTFDPITKIIQVDQAPAGGYVDLDVKVDLYSDGKEDWITDPNLTKIPFPIRSVGGDPISETESLGATYFLDEAWKIRPYEASHVLRVEGNFFAEDQSDPFINTIGSYVVRIVYKVSALTTLLLGDAGDIVDDVEERLSAGNLAIQPMAATEIDAVRNVRVGDLDRVVMKWKNDLDSDWDSPRKTVTQYAWYQTPGDNQPIMKENG